MTETTHAVLVVDDDPDIRESLCDLIGDQGYRVLAAANGKEALAILRGGERVCVILLDLMMPVMDGWAFRQEQQTDEALAQIPVVVITASGKTNGAFAKVLVLRKPLRFDTVIGAVQERCPS